VELGDLPVGTVTFLFTDMEGSTRRWEETPGPMSEALSRHDALLEKAIAEHGGIVFSKAGDGMAAVFALAPNALAAAVAAQEAVAAEPWDSTGPIRVRMGLHTGEGVLLGDSYSSQPLNRCARLMAAAHGGQVLVSGTTAALVHDRISGQIQLVDLGEHRLRDLAQPMRVFQVGAGSFPPLRSLDALPTNLPAQASVFVGRDTQLVEVAEALAASRVVTLTGVGGVGKTRLAVQAAADILPEYRDGAWLVELAPAVDAEAVLELVALALGVEERQGQTLSVCVADFLREKQLLIVLDNCEHLLDAVANFVSGMVANSRNLAVLATSREGLGVSGERILVVPSLELPMGESSAEAVGHADAVRLFVERATEAKADFALTDANAPAVARLVHRLDGIPLAIELAAARVRSLTAAELAERVDERFRLLAGGRRTPVERHQTLRRAIDWSYELLAPSEQTTLNRSAVFAADFGLDAAESVIAGDGITRPDVFDLLGRLVDKSLMSAEDRGGSTRFQLLETIRQYAQERLEGSGEADALRRRYAEYWVNFAATAGRGLRGTDEAAWTERVETELDHLRTALAWSVDQGDADLAMRLVTPLALHGTRVGDATGTWSDPIVAMPEAQRHPLYPQVLGWVGWTKSIAGEHEQAVRIGREALDAAARIGVDARTLCRVLSCVGPIYVYVADFDEGGRLAKRWIEAARKLQDEWELSNALAFAWVHFDTSGDHAAAIACTDEAMTLARRLGNPSMLCYAAGVSGAARLESDPVSALQFYAEGLEAAESVGNRLGIGLTLGGQAWIRIQRGEWYEAAPLVVRALQGYHRAGDHEGFLMWCPEAVLILEALGDDEASATLFGVAKAATYDTTEALVDRMDASQLVLRRRLGDERFDECVARGSGMDYDELTAFISGNLERVTTE
jgi:predicted ATPase/class 3 adenylate cyclase